MPAAELQMSNAHVIEFLMENVTTNVVAAVCTCKGSLDFLKLWLNKGLSLVINKRYQLNIVYVMYEW